MFVEILYYYGYFFSSTNNFRLGTWQANNPRELPGERMLL